MWCLQDIRQKTLYICVPYICLPDIRQKTCYILSSTIVFAEYSPEDLVNFINFKSLYQIFTRNVFCKLFFSQFLEFSYEDFSFLKSLLLA